MSVVISIISRLFVFLQKISLSLVIRGIIFGAIGKHIYDYYVRYIREKRKNLDKWGSKGLFLPIIVSGFISFIYFSDFQGNSVVGGSTADIFYRCPDGLLLAPRNWRMGKSFGE